MTHTLSPEDLCAAYLSDAERTRDDLPWSACDAGRLLQVLRQNKVPLMGLAQRPGSEALLSDARFEAARQEEVERLTSLRDEYEKLYQAQTQAGIDAVLIKSVGLAPSFPFKSDNLDVLYRLRDVEAIKGVLRGLGYVELKNVEEPHKYLFRKFHAGRSVSAIHVHAHVGWMVSFLDEERLWQRFRAAPDDDHLFVPAPEDALLTNLAHWFSEDKRLTLEDVVKCACCLRQGVDWEEVFRVATWRGWGDGLAVALLLYSHQEWALFGQTLVPEPILQRAWAGAPPWARVLLERHLGKPPAIGQQGRWDGSPASVVTTPLSVPFLFSKALFYAKLLRDPSRHWRSRLKDCFLHLGYGTKLRLRIHSQPPMLITLSGVDGAGKTTQVRALQAALNTCDLRATQVWYRAGSARWVSMLTRFAKRGATAGPPQPTPSRVESRRQRLRSPWARQAWSWLTTVELLLKYSAHVAVPLLLGRVVICDRYVYDALADWSAYFGEPDIEKRVAARVLLALTPHPRLAYWLDLPPEEALARSQDGTPASFLATLSEAYRRVAASQGLHRVNGSQTWEAISSPVVSEVLTTYFADYHTWLNGLFLKNPGQWR